MFQKGNQLSKGNLPNKTSFKRGHIPWLVDFNKQNNQENKNMKKLLAIILISLAIPVFVQAGIFDWFNNLFKPQTQEENLGATLLFPSRGGTGIGSYSRGDILVATSTNQFYKLATGTEGYVLTISSGIPAWAASTGGGSAATTINGASGPTFTFSTSSDTNIGLAISTSTGAVIFTSQWIGTLADSRIASASNWNTAYGWNVPTNYLATGTIGVSVQAYDANNATTGSNVASASALASNGSNCGAGNAPLGIDASGNVENCFDVWTEAENTAAGYLTTVAYSDLTGYPADVITAGDLLSWSASTTLNATVTKSDVGLGSVENTALSTWGGSTNILTVGTIATGTWQGTAIADAYVANDITLTNITQITNRAISDLTGTLAIASTTGTLTYDRGGTGTTTALALQNLWWGDGTGNLVQVASSTLAGGGGVSSLNEITGQQ